MAIKPKPLSKPSPLTKGKIGPISTSARGGSARAGGKVSSGKASPLVSPLVSPPPEPETKGDTFPLISAMSPADFQLCKRLIEEMRDLKEQAAAVKEGQDEAKAQMLALHEKYGGWPGFRYGTSAVYFATKTRKSLDKTLLLENGVTTDQINASYKESEPWQEVTVRELQRPD